MRISPVVLIMLALQFALATLGTHFSYRGMTEKRGAIFRYVFLYFLSLLIIQIMSVVQILIVHPNNQALVLVSRQISNTSIYLSFSAFVVLALGCYLAWGRGECN